MKKVVVILLYIIIILMGAILVNAQTEENLQGKAGITPDNTLLWTLERFTENLRLFLTFNQTKKAELMLQFLDERLAEMQDMLNKNNIRAAEKAQKAREDSIVEIENLEIDNKTKAEIINNLQKHISVLQDVLEKSPESARKGLENALNKSSKIIEKFEIKQNATEKKPKQEKPAEISNITNASNITCGYCQYLVDNTCLNYGCCNNNECKDNESCSEHECKSLECGTCQYTQNHKCVSYECCKNEDCSETKICVDYTCEALSCGTCQHIENHRCISYECCKDEDCNTEQMCSANKCINKPSGDTTPPIITITNPQNNSIATTDSVWFNVTTNENAVCIYEERGWVTSPCCGGGGVSRPRNMSETGGIEHSQLIIYLQNGTNYKISVSCTDSSGNSNTNSVSFVASLS